MLASQGRRSRADVHGPAQSQAKASAAGESGLPRSAVAWAAFEGFRNPAVVLITIYVFMPYYVAEVAETPVAGQALVATAGQVAGWIVALSAPLLGLLADRLGRRKPPLTATVLAMAPLYAAMWWVMPNGPIGPALFLAIAAGKSVLFAWTEIFHNALLVPAAGRRASEASGLGLALGNLVSVVALVALLWGFALPGVVDWPLVPAAPLFGIDQGLHEHARMSGPVVAVSLLVGLSLILLFVPDAPATGMPLGSAVRAALGDLGKMLGELKREREAAKFLLARMLYVDGKTALLLFGGVLAAGVMGWGTLEMLAYGIILSCLAVAGGFLAAPLDRRLGPKGAVLLAIGVTAVVLGLLLLSGPDRTAGVETGVVPHGLWASPFFTSWQELAYIAIAGVSAVSITAAYASSRTLLTRLVPPKRLGTFFGLYALSGTATMWLGPLLVALGTVWFQSQQGGLAMVLLLLTSGFLMLLTVRAPRANA
jgi:UMF1 family MFS transporter